MDVIEYATGLRPVLIPALAELGGSPATRLATVIVAATLVLQADGVAVEAAMLAARKVLAELRGDRWRIWANNDSVRMR